MKFADWKAEVEHHEKALEALQITHRGYLLKRGGEDQWVADVSPLLWQAARSHVFVRREIPGTPGSPSTYTYDYREHHSLPASEMIWLGQLMYQFERWRDGYRDAPPTPEEWNAEWNARA